MISWEEELEEEMISWEEELEEETPLEKEEELSLTPQETSSKGRQRVRSRDFFITAL